MNAKWTAQFMKEERIYMDKEYNLRSDIEDMRNKIEDLREELEIVVDDYLELYEKAKKLGIDEPIEDYAGYITDYEELIDYIKSHKLNI